MSSGASEDEGSVAVVIRALLANLGITIAKFVVAIIASSAAMLAEAVHSLADTGNQVILLVGMRQSKRSEDSRHEFGYGSERYFWAFIVAVSLFTIGATFSIYEGVQKIVHRDTETLGNPIYAFIVVGISFALEMFSLSGAISEFNQFKAGRTFRKAFQESRDPVVFVVMFEDTADIIGLFLALVGLALAKLTGDVIWDGIFSINVGIVLAGVAAYLALKTKHLLIGEAVTEKERDRIVELTKTTPGVQKLIHLRTLHLGPEDVIVAMKVAFGDDATTTKIADTVDVIEDRLRTEMPHLKRIYVETGTIAEPSRPQGPRGAADRAHTS
jgi:cation diffusion facilitator family transporter